MAVTTYFQLNLTEHLLKQLFELLNREQYRRLFQKALLELHSPELYQLYQEVIQVN